MFEEIDKNYIRESEKIRIKLVGINNIANMKEMFYKCYHLASISVYQKMNRQNFESNNILLVGDIYSSLFGEIYDYSNIENISALSLFNDLFEVNTTSNNIYKRCSQSTSTISSIPTHKNHSNSFDKNGNIKIY